MQATVRMMAGLVVVHALSVGVQAGETSAPDPWAVYQGLEPGTFIKRWLLCDPFPVFKGAPRPQDVAAQREAFDKDFLAETVIGRFITRKVVASISFQRRAGTNLYEKFTNVVSPRGDWQYSGKVVVLTNEGCASACEHFVSGMYEAGALLVGTPTVGACGWSKRIELPAGVELRCSLTFPLHGKTPSPLNGIAPHYLVTPTIEDLRAGRDIVLEKAKELLR